MPDDNLYTKPLQRRRKRLRWVSRFKNSSTISAAIMLLAAVVALVFANSPAHEALEHFWHTPVSLSFGGFTADSTVLHLVNDLLMSVFFVVVGLEIKHEVLVGELKDVKAALLPIMAAVGGCVAPIGIYLALNLGNGGVSGWGVPMATDIAFALGILLLLGSRVPVGLKVFLTALAIVDDILAILVIAVFYGQAPSLGWLLAGALVFGVMMALNRLHIYQIAPYLFFGSLLWVCLAFADVHPTLAGVLLAVAVPGRSMIDPHVFVTWARERLHEINEDYDHDEPVLAQHSYNAKARQLETVAYHATPPLVSLMEVLKPISTFIALPLFALGNAGVHLAGIDPSAMLGNPVFLGVLLGLVVGKPLGIMALSALTVKLRLAHLPDGVTWPQMLGASVLGGIGFTMSIFVANLAFDLPEQTTVAKAAILLASLCAAVIGYLVLLRLSKGNAD